MISVDTVYQTVLALANKEQRGYITPQEFNLHADHAQMSIFEQYFYDINQFKRIPGNNHSYADAINNLDEKISIFITENSATVDNLGNIDLSGISNFYRLGTVKVDYSGTGDNLVLVEELGPGEKELYEAGPLTKYSRKRPVFQRYGSSNSQILQIFPHPDLNLLNNLQPMVTVRYIYRPISPKWTYIVINDKALYNSGAVDRVDFSLHPADQTELVVKILQLAGVTIKDNNLIQAAAQEETKNIQQEKR